MAQLDPKPDFPKLEEAVLARWEAERIFEQSLTKDAPKGEFVFWEGPPTANGRPGLHHVLARTFKDVIPRFRTMQGYRVQRKAGWDTHGLPVELEVEKKLRISGKKAIEDIVPGDPRASIIEFNRLCRSSVWEYKEDWEKLTKRIGFWLDLRDPFVTYDASYIETLWWILAQIDRRGLLELDYKVVPYCPRCETALSSHEVAQGYEDDVEDPSVYIAFPLVTEDCDGCTETFLLVWTTTPWTLPGNVALAVAPKEPYVTIRFSSGQFAKQQFILAKKRLAVIREDYQIIQECDGQTLVNRSYFPLYSLTRHERAYKVQAADFVSMDDGTGIVHVAPAFGEDDFQLGKREALPILRTVDSTGLIQTGDDINGDAAVPGQGMFVKAADPVIIDDLKKRGIVYRSETIRHTYPFCWRCKTPLIYYAKESWYIRMSQLREALLARNAAIDWVPSHIRDGRMGEWLKEAKDWAISRDRYWGTPLPIWICDRCGTKRVVSSLDELAATLAKRNRFLFLRHGEAAHSVEGRINSQLPGTSLTARGKEAITSLTTDLQEQGITKIVSSPYARTKETAEIIGQALGLAVDSDDRLVEMDFAAFHNQPVQAWRASVPKTADRWERGAPGGETWRQVRRRMLEAIGELNSRYAGETILVVSHGDPLYVLYLTLAGKGETVGLESSDLPYPKLAELREVSIPLFDPHRPYVDDLTFPCEHDRCAGTLKRIPDVIDVWFDSGAMPYAQAGWQGSGTLAYPADYIAEAIDQTRGWFYTLLSVATLLEDCLPESVKTAPVYRHVICLGLLLDEQGQKMSKSRGNIMDPWEVINQSGVDGLRLTLLTMNQPGEPKRFALEAVGETLRRSLLLLWNTTNYWLTYRHQAEAGTQPSPAAQLFDRWLLAAMDQVGERVTSALEAYDPFTAGRTLIDWIGDLSTWYLRRSRGRTDATFVATLGQALKTTFCWLAPMTPFVTDYLWQVIRRADDPRSVHLAVWPELPKDWQDPAMLAAMATVRKITESGHAARNGLKIKLRQPLASATVTGTPPLAANWTAIIADELNVKQVHYASGDNLTVSFDATLTTELRLEGYQREVLRQIQSLRKERGLTIGEPAAVHWSSEDPALQSVLRSPTLAALLPTTVLTEARLSPETAVRAELDQKDYWLDLTKNA